jgi:hypothetical protein
MQQGRNAPPADHISEFESIPEVVGSRGKNKGCREIMTPELSHLSLLLPTLLLHTHTYTLRISPHAYCMLVCVVCRRGSSSSSSSSITTAMLSRYSVHPPLSPPPPPIYLVAYTLSLLPTASHVSSCVSLPATHKLFYIRPHCCTSLPLSRSLSSLRACTVDGSQMLNYWILI